MTINKKHPDLTEVSLAEFCEEFGVDYQVMKIKTSLINKIKNHCEKNKISQRKLASMVTGLTHDRINKVFNGKISNMTVDKLLQIAHALDIMVNISFSKTVKNDGEAA